MIRDQLPGGNLGFGITRNSLPNQEEVEAADPNAGVFERALHDNPLAKFFTHTALTLTGAVVATAIAKGSGKNALRKIAMRAASDRASGLNSGYVRALDTFRDVQRTMDEYSGVTSRLRGVGKTSNGLTYDDPTADAITQNRGFIFSRSEVEEARSRGETAAEWTYREEIQQRLVRQARRLPYELPAAYVTQRLVADPLLGTGGEDPVDWTNPVDIIGDFAQQSIKNIAFAMVPFEVGTGVAKQAWRKGMTEATEIGLNATRSKGQERLVGLNSSLHLLGHESADLLAKGIRYSRQSTGASAHAITYAASRQKGVVEAAHQARKRGVSNWFNDVREGRESFGPASQIRDIKNAFRQRKADIDKKSMERTYMFGGSKFEQFADGLARLSGRTDEADFFTDGTFFKTEASRSYKKFLSEQLSSRGVDSDTAADFLNLYNFAPPVSANAKTALGKRITNLNGDKIFEGDDTWVGALGKTIEPKFKGQSSAIAQSIEDAMKSADRQYMSQLPTMQKNLQAAYRKVYDTSIADEVKKSLGHRKAAWRDFGANISKDNSEWLLRRTAERSNISLVRSSGARSTSELRDDLKRIGFDPDNKAQLRAFLVEKGDISTPWNPTGTNIFGIRAMSVQEALDRKVFQDKPRIEREVQDMAKALSKRDFDAGMLDRLKVGGIYTIPGRNGSAVINLNPLRKSARRFMDTTANETQVPLIHLNPLTLFGYGARQSADSGPAIRIMNSNAGALRDDNASSYLWFRSGRARGSVVKLNVQGRKVESERLSQTFRPTPVGPDSIAGRSVLQARNESGRSPRLEPTGIRRLFNVDPYQPDSFGSLVKRFKGRKTDPNNVGTFAARLLRGDLPANDAQTAEGMQTLMQYLRNSSFSPEITAKLKANIGSRSELLKIFEVDGKNIFDMDADDLQKAMALKFRDTSYAGIPRTQQQMVARAKTNLLDRWVNDETPESLLNILPKPKRSLGLNRNIDEARMDFLRYMSVESNALGSSTKFRSYADNLVKEINDLEGGGFLTTREAAENRAAIGSMYTTFSSMQAYRSGMTDQDVLLKVAQSMKAGQPGVTVEEGVRQVLEDTANYARSGVVGKMYKSRFGVGPYKYDGYEYNPLGSNEILVPTFSSAFAQNPLKATLSAAGLTSWSDPQNFSGASIGASHLFDRINRATQMFGMALDPTKYKGPADMYIRGMIGQRALPIFAAGATLMAVDRTAGGYAYNDKDEEGNRIYRPLVTGFVADAFKEARVGISALTPGGMTGDEKREQLEEGLVAVRSGRFWPIGNTPFRGGKVQYYRPSWYRRFKSGYQYTDQTYGSPLERLAFNYDFSPLRPFDPYRFERQTAEERPYPVSGEYFTGPWGPLTGLLNATAGQVLKPQRRYNEDEVEAALASYTSVGQGAIAPGFPAPVGALQGAAGTPAYASGSAVAPTQIAAVNQGYQAAAGTPAYTSGTGAVAQQLGQVNAQYMAAAYDSGIYSSRSIQYPFAAPFTSPYDVVNPRQPGDLVGAQNPISAGSVANQLTNATYGLQEFAGIYGFGFGAAREALGFGDMEYETTRPVLASASQAYGSGRAFWDLNLGGLGDFPTPLEGEYANLEVSEIVRRFIPKPRDLNYINPIQNSLGRENPWLPSNDYFIDFTRGDPYVKIPEGEMRLPGTAYERFYDVEKEDNGQYSMFDQFRILADVAPYSDQFRILSNAVGEELTPPQEAEYEQILRQVDDVKRQHDFVTYEDKANDPLSLFTHADTYFNTKFAPNRTATEDWERFNVYGSTFPQWTSPIESFVEPTLNKARDRNPVTAALGLGFVGGLFGSSPRARSVGRLVGGIVGGTASALTNVGETVSGERFVPDDYKQEVAVEEYVDILKYTRAVRGFSIAERTGNEVFSSYFKDQIKSTMYGADLLGSTAEELSKALPKRKREHFLQMINAPEDERDRILSTAGRLERRIYQAAWGREIEQRPDLGEYFSERELPGPESEIWDPRTNFEQVEIKILQQQGLDPSALGYFPQQVDQANLVNPAYPDLSMGSSGNVQLRLLQLLQGQGLRGDVSAIPNPFGDTRVELYNGV